MKQKVIGKWIMVIAIVILAISILIRFAEAEKRKEHIRVDGKVSRVEETSEWVRAGKRIVKSSDYTVWIRFQPLGWIHEDVIVENHIDDYFSKGDTVAVMYPEDALYYAYSAKKDWLTGEYLPVSNSYDAALVISVLLFAGGVVLFCSDGSLGQKKASV